jgi:hypothetical protein
VVDSRELGGFNESAAPANVPQNAVETQVEGFDVFHLGNALYPKSRRLVVGFRRREVPLEQFSGSSGSR